MGKLSTFKIVFSKNKDKYRPGDVVEGHVAIEIKDGIKVKGKWNFNNNFIDFNHDVSIWMQSALGDTMFWGVRNSVTVTQI